MKIKTPLLLSIVGFLIGLYLSKFYQCGYSVFCYSLAIKSEALYYGAGALTLIFVVLLFIPKAFSAWKRFAIWFIPLAALLFVFYPEPGSGDFFSPHAETVYRWVSGLYILISASIISFVRFQKK